MTDDNPMMSFVTASNKKRDSYRQDRQERLFNVEDAASNRTSKKSEVPNPPQHEEIQAEAAPKPRIGRPNRKNRSAHLTILMNPALKEAVKDYAYENRISVSDFIDQVSTQFLKEHGFWKE